VQARCETAVDARLKVHELPSGRLQESGRSAPRAASDRAAAARGATDERAKRGAAIRCAPYGLPTAESARAAIGPTGASDGGGR
jgi:hypothetical protein